MAVRLLAVAMVLVSIVSPAMAADQPALAPSGPWNLIYAADSCALRRTFGAGEDRAYLEFRRFQPGLGLQTVIASSRMKPLEPVTIRYRFGGDTDWREVEQAVAVSVDRGFEGVLFDSSLLSLPEYEELEDPLEKAAYLRENDLPTLEREAAARADTITLRRPFRKELSLQLGPLHAPIAALNTCIDELMTHWDIDVEAHKTLTRPATPLNLSEVGSIIDYPPKMVWQSMPGVVNIRLAIDETGRITGCHIQMPLSDPAFEETSCVGIQHALDFDPALDKDGKPIASYWVSKVKFGFSN